MLHILLAMEFHDPSSLEPDFVLKPTAEPSGGAKEILFCYPPSKQRRAYIGELSSQGGQHSWLETSKEQAELKRLKLMGSGYRVDYVSAAMKGIGKCVSNPSTRCSAWPPHQEMSREDTELYDPDVFEYGLTDT